MAPVQSNVSLLENTTLHLAVYSSGHPLPLPSRHIWTLNDAIIPNSTRSQDGRELTVPSVQFQKDSRYACTVGTFTGGRYARYSANFTVTVYGECRRCQWTLEITIRDSHITLYELHTNGNVCTDVTDHKVGFIQAIQCRRQQIC